MCGTALTHLFPLLFDRCLFTGQGQGAPLADASPSSNALLELQEDLGDLVPREGVALSRDYTAPLGLLPRKCPILCIY